MKMSETIRMTDEEIIAAYKRLNVKPDDVPGYEWRQGKLGWRKHKILDPEVAEAKKKKLVDRLLENAIPAKKNKDAQRIETRKKA